MPVGDEEKPFSNQSGLQFRNAKLRFTFIDNETKFPQKA